ncbi:MAG: DNA mismatch repair endonuclease MutL [Clostridia bacterium]|nr:DNA mismatch repair endonuclease MutL [Clostridia bacterium]
MAVINLLPKSVSELIAAGEVVERPASVVKETVENSIDAGSRRITVEIKHGGISYIRIADDGCGMDKEDVPMAFLRHATSKIHTENDLDSIETLGFRGEALAAISGVSKVEVFTKTENANTGTHYIIEGGAEVVFEEAGCATGTTLIIKDLFYNTPARMKFLKKDSTEGTAVQSLLERMALSHPEIAFKFIKDTKLVFQTAGDNNLSNAVYSVLGREIHSTLIPANEENKGISVSGFVCKPVYCRASRNWQYTFLNGRLVISKTVIAAVEQAYKDSNMVGKFPVFILFIKLPAGMVDVNVHPAKTEVRFSDERIIFSCVYSAVKNAIFALDTRPEITINRKSDNFYKMTADEYRQTAVSFEDKKSETKIDNTPFFHSENTPFFLREDVKEYKKQNTVKAKPIIETNNDTVTEPAVLVPKEDIPIAEAKPQEYDTEKEVSLVGEVYNLYIIAQMGDTLYLIDKHAAHERILYNKFKAENHIERQQLLIPQSVGLTEAEHRAAVENADLLSKVGFEVEDFGGTNILVREIPAMLDKSDIASTVAEAVSTIVYGGEANLKSIDDIYHTVACKAAIKAGYITTREEMLSLARRVLGDRDVMYCPHGRPVAYAISRRELDRYFGRIQ